jgi:hypothetical protein
VERARPSFAWVHFFDPHVAYDPPEPFASQSENAYDGEIAFVDRQIGHLLESVRVRRGRDTLIVVAGDHGEGLGEHGEWSHGSLAQEATLRIPLVIAATRGVPGGIHVPTRISQVDLVPTILSMLGVPVPDGLDGIALTRPVPRDRGVLAEGVHEHVLYGWAPLSVLYEGSWKLVDGPNPELYDLERDPLEQRDLREAEAAELSRLQTRLEELRGTLADVALSPPSVILSAEEVAQLEALGYAVGPERVHTRRLDGPDPKEMLALSNEVKELVTLYDAGSQGGLVYRTILRLRGLPVSRSLGELIEAIEAFTEAHPDFAPGYHQLAMVYRRAGMHEESRKTFQRLEALVR